MQRIYLTPGPSHPYPRLRAFLDDAWAHDIVAISHRGKAFSDIYNRTETALRMLMSIPQEHVVVFVGSATEAMERSVQGVVHDRSHHFIQGEFGEKWFKIAEQLGKHPSATRAHAGRPFPGLDVPHDAELICITHNETSTGAMVPDRVLSQLVSLPHRPLVGLDVVSSAPLADVPWAQLDVVFFSVQKAFGLPAGLGVLVLSPRAVMRSQELARQGAQIGSYHSLLQLVASAEKHQTPTTPNVLGIYLLGRVAEDMTAQGIAALREENRNRATQLYEIMQANEHFTPFVPDAEWQSPTVIVAEVNHGNAHLLQQLEARQLVLGKGYKDFADAHVRIANFPAMDDVTFNTLTRHLRQYAPA